MSRYYLVIPLNQFLCLEATAAKNGEARSHEHTHDHGPAASIHEHTSESQETGYTITHCKDTINGVALTPVQTLAPIEVATVLEPQTIWMSVAPASSSVLDTYLPTPFEPPRT
jgi:hypothetical protein